MQSGSTSIVPRIGFAALTVTAAIVVQEPARAAPAPEAAAVAQQIWSKLLVHCGESWFYAGSIFDQQGLLGDVTAGASSVREFRGVRFHAVPIPVTEADRLNGISAHVRITMISHAYREKGGQWLNGPDLQPRDTDDILGQALGQANGDMFDMGGGGAMALDLLRTKGQWAVARSSLTLSGGVGFNSNYFYVDKLLAAKVARYECSTASVVQPQLTEAEIREAMVQYQLRRGLSRQDAEQFADYYARKQFGIEQDQIHLHDPKKGVPFLAISADQMAKLKQLEAQTDISSKEHTLRASDDRYQLWTNLQKQFPQTPTADQWLAPGTEIKVECYQVTPTLCTDFQQASVNGGPKSYIAVQVTSGPHAGQYVVIEHQFFHFTRVAENTPGVAGFAEIQLQW